MGEIYYNGVREVNGPCPANVLRLDLGVLPCIYRMASNGLLIDREHFRKLSVYLGQEKDRLTEEVRKCTGYYINVGSPDQIEALLFKKMKLKVPPHFKLTESGKRYIVDDEALTSIKDVHPVVPLIQQFTEVHKLKAAFADTLPVIADKKDGRVRTNLGTTRQVSGRISSSKPNLMAQPTRSDLGKEIRKGFIAGPGNLIGTIDQSQIEMRFAAHFSGCMNMIDTFLRNGDIHVETATRIFFSHWEAQLGRMPTKKEATAMGMDDMRHRYPAKRIGFGVLFGITADGLQDQIFVADDKTWTEEDRLKFRAEWPTERCQQTINMWFAAYPEIRTYMNNEFSKARRFGYVWDMFGRIRWIPQVKSVHRKIVAEGLRACGNLRIQASATGSMKLFLAEVFDTLIMKKYLGLVEPLLAIHDEGLFEGRADVMPDFFEDCHKIMQRVVRLDVPLKSGSDIGESWGDLSK